MKIPASVFGAVSGRATISTKKSEQPAEQAARNPFMPASEKLTIVSLDADNLQVAAQFNPKELGISKSIQWQQHNERDNRAPKERDPREGQATEYNGGGQRNMTIELFFDRMESLGSSEEKSIEELMDDLNTLASIQNPDDTKPDKRRPHYCVIVWGIGGIRPFRCVIESIDIKYTMFNPLGVPLRATATVKVKETAISIKDRPLNAKETRSLNGRS